MSTGEDVTVQSSDGGIPDGPNPYTVAIPADPEEHEKTTDAKTLYTRPTSHSSVFYPPPDGWIYRFNWDTIRAGDCRMESAAIWLYPDTQIYFQASTFTSSSGDVWIVRGIQFFDTFGHQLGGSVPKHDGMNMAWEGSEYPFVWWDTIPGVAPSGASQIRSASMTNHC